MKRLLLTLSAASAISFGVVAQSNGERTITGTVTYAGDNEPLIGATVMPVGTAPVWPPMPTDISP